MDTAEAALIEDIIADVHRAGKITIGADDPVIIELLVLRCWFDRYFADRESDALDTANEILDRFSTRVAQLEKDVATLEKFDKNITLLAFNTAQEKAETAVMREMEKVGRQQEYIQSVLSREIGKRQGLWFIAAIASGILMNVTVYLLLYAFRFF